MFSLLLLAALGLLLALSFNVNVKVNAFSTTPKEQPKRQFIEITNPLKDQSQPVADRLPVSFVSNWPTWVLDPHSNKSSSNSDDQQTQPSAAMSWHRIPDSDGFVPPTSLDELWQPQDLKRPQCRLALGLHIRNGMIRHILPAVDLSFRGDGARESHRNRGLCSVPRAYQWMDFGAAMAGGLDVVSLSLQVRKISHNTTASNGDDRGDVGDDDDDANGDADNEEWETLAEVKSMEASINKAIEALADDPPEDLGDGSSVVHVLFPQQETIVIDCPRPDSEMRVVLEEDGYPVGHLRVAIRQTSPGSESKYLPAAYKPLFEDEVLRRPAFVESRKRMELKKQQDALKDDGDGDQQQ